MTTKCNFYILDKNMQRQHFILPLLCAAQAAPQRPSGFSKAKLTTVSTWHEEMILLAHTSYLFAQCRTGTYPPFWALGRSPMQEYVDKLEFVAYNLSSIFFQLWVVRQLLPKSFIIFSHNLYGIVIDK